MIHSVVRNYHHPPQKRTDVVAAVAVVVGDVVVPWYVVVDPLWQLRMKMEMVSTLF